MMNQVPEDLEQYYSEEKDEYRCPGCDALYNEREVFRLHLDYCGEIE